MIRVFRKRAEQIAVMLTNLKGYVSHKFDTRESANVYLMNRYTFENDPNGTLRSHISYAAKRVGYDQNSLTLDEIIKELMDLVNQSQDGSYKDLLDEIVALLQMPRGAFVMGGETFAALQRAVLIPEEIREFKKAAAEALNCNGCGRRVAPGEMATISTSDGVPVLHCIKCRYPEFVPCGKCGTAVAYKQYTPGNVHYCPQHNSKSAKQAAGPLVTAPDPTANRSMEGLRGIDPGVFRVAWDVEANDPVTRTPRPNTRNQILGEWIAMREAERPTPADPGQPMEALRDPDAPPTRARLEFRTPRFRP